MHGVDARLMSRKKTDKCLKRGREIVVDVQSMNEQGWSVDDVGGVDHGEGLDDVRKMLRDERESGGSTRTSLPSCYFPQTEMRLPFPTTHVTFLNRQEESSSSRLISQWQTQALTQVFTSFARLNWAAGARAVATWKADSLLAMAPLVFARKTGTSDVVCKVYTFIQRA